MIEGIQNLLNFLNFAVAQLTVPDRCVLKLLQLYSHFNYQVASARTRHRDRLVFESSCPLPTCLPHTVKASHCSFQCLTSSKEAVNTNFYSLWFDPTGNRIRIYRFSSRRSIHSKTDRLNDVIYSLLQNKFVSNL